MISEPPFLQGLSNEPTKLWESDTIVSCFIHSWDHTGKENFPFGIKLKTYCMLVTDGFDGLLESLHGFPMWKLCSDMKFKVVQYF